jgi:5-methylcytosine-specific restriction endonuclease McrBC GTP-binding regulatory subunit McrB
MTDSEKVILKELVLKALHYLDINSWDSKNNSRTGDLVYNGKLYPTKPILWNIEEQINKDNLEVTLPSLSGGEAIFKFLESLDFEIKRKEKEIDLYQLKKDFLNEWPLSRIQNMTLEEYTNLDKTSFCYWLEAKTHDLGSIWGGSSYKFGIYKRRDISTTITVDNRITDGEYAWFTKYGTTKETAFETVKNIIISIITNSQNDTIENIDTLDLGDAYKWKIAFLYGNFNVVNIFKNESVLEAAQSLGYKDVNKSYSALNRFIINQKQPEIDYFEFTHELWAKTTLATGKQYWLFAPGENAFKWDEFYNQGIMGLGWDNLGDLSEYKSKKDIQTKLQELDDVTSSKINDTTANYEFSKTMRIGDIIFVKKGIGELLGYGVVASDYYFDEEREEYKSCRKMNWICKGNWKTGLSFPVKTLTDVTRYNANNSDFNKYHEELMAIIEGKTSINKKAIPLNNSPLNQILYGPPGTGKTYKTILEAAKIVTGNETINYDEALRVFNENLNNQIEFITFHQNYSYEDFIQGLRPDTENGKDLSFEKKDGVFKRIADRALKNIEASNNPASAKKDFELVFQELIQPLNDGDVEELEIKMRKSSFYITEVGEKSIEFRKNIGDSNHTLSINTLRKMYDKGENDIILGGLQPYYNPILELLLMNGKSQVISVSRKNYVIIIDEINRANISRVFGELITLEEDKRSHGKIPMRVTLPSGDSFIVPSNLYIIGTMNTADKSISLLDIALRRRFEFIPMYSNSLIEGINSPTVLETINAEIIKRKGHDFTIGHAYFMGEEYSLEKTINNKVIPLLLEYFMNDGKEVATILKAAEIEVIGWPMQMKTA